MYKKFSLEQLLKLKTWFFVNLQKLITQRRYPTLKTFLKDITKEWSTIYYFQRGTPLFRIIQNQDDNYTFIDEQEKIELTAWPDALSKLHSMFKNDRNVSRQSKSAQSMSDILRTDFKEGGKFKNINWKPYIVYDIETTYATNNLKDVKFYLWYAFIVDEEWKWKYSYIGPENLEKFVKFMIDFDWYIVWFNNVAFDNPVSVYNTTDRNQEMINTLNAKSIDLFLILRNITGKKLWLNRTATALVWIQKTLESGAEWETLMKQYQETWDEKFLNEFKLYCKNDVEMTVLVMFYLLKNKKVYLDETEFTFTKEDFLHFATKYYSKAAKSDVNKMTNKIFQK